MTRDSDRYRDGRDPQGLGAKPESAGRQASPDLGRTNLTDRLGELVDKVMPGPYEAKRAAKPDNTGGFDWAIIATDKAIIGECFEHVDWREEGVSYETSPAQANAEFIALCFTHKDEILSALRGARDIKAALAKVIGARSDGGNGGPPFVRVSFDKPGDQNAFYSLVVANFPEPPARLSLGDEK